MFEQGAAALEVVEAPAGGCGGGVEVEDGEVGADCGVGFWGGGGGGGGGGEVRVEVGEDEGGGAEGGVGACEVGEGEGEGGEGCCEVCFLGFVVGELLFELAGFFEDGWLRFDGLMSSSSGMIGWGKLGLEVIVPFSEIASVLLESFSLFEELDYLEWILGLSIVVAIETVFGVEFRIFADVFDVDDGLWSNRWPLRIVWRVCR